MVMNTAACPQGAIMGLGRLNKQEIRVLELALEHYVRLGLGQLSDIAIRLSLLLTSIEKEKLTRLQELMAEAEQAIGGSLNFSNSEVSRYTLIALLLQARLNNDLVAIKWITERLKTTKDQVRE